MKTRVLFFGDTSGGSVELVNKAIEKYLAKDFEFEYLNWHNYDLHEFARLYAWSDVVLTCLSAHNQIIEFVTKSHLTIDFRKCLLVTHDSNEHTVVSEYNRLFSYAQVCACDKTMFPPDVTVHLMPNGVDPDNFVYRPRDGTLSKMGWVGRIDYSIKQPEWARLISVLSGLPLSIQSACQPVKPASYMAEWYQTVDLLIVTAVPEWTSETGPLPPFEAIVSGIPAIGTPVGNFRDVPGPKFTTVDQAVKIVKELRENPDRMKVLALEQYKYVMAHNTYAVLADAWRSGINATRMRSSFQN